MDVLVQQHVYLPIGPTGLQSIQRQIFQSMDIETRINKGQIDIIVENIN